MPKFVSKTHTKDSPADHNYANDLETRIGNAIDPIANVVSNNSSQSFITWSTEVTYYANVASFGKIISLNLRVKQLPTNINLSYNIALLEEKYRPFSDIVLYVNGGYVLINADGTIVIHESQKQNVIEINVSYGTK